MAEINEDLQRFWNRVLGMDVLHERCPQFETTAYTKAYNTLFDATLGRAWRISYANKPAILSLQPRDSDYAIESQTGALLGDAGGFEMQLRLVLDVWEPLDFRPGGEPGPEPGV